MASTQNDSSEAGGSLNSVYEESRRRALGSSKLSQFYYNSPWWFILLGFGWLYIVMQMASNPDYSDAYKQMQEGIPLTIWLAVASYALALIFGLLIGVLRANPPRVPETRLPLRRALASHLHLIAYNLATLYVEFMRGIPALVFLLIFGFIVVPSIREPVESAINTTIIPLLRQFNPEIGDVTWRGRDPATFIAGASLFYGAFLSEVFRAGIQSVPKGQVEAAKSLGMTYFQNMRHVVIPQAIRNILPPLGNDFIAMIKDTSLATILGTTEITQLARQWSGSQFTYLETYAVLSIIYLTMTVSGSLLVQYMERNLKTHVHK
jgi:polar amino acid transport system permease protein